MEEVADDDEEDERTGRTGRNGYGASGSYDVVICRRRKRRRRLDVDDGDDSRAKRKRRRRCPISLCNFQLFGDDEQCLKGRMGAVRASDAGLSDEDKFRKSIRRMQSCIVSLQQNWKDAALLRCSGKMRRDQKFVCMATARDISSVCSSVVGIDCQS